MRGRNGAWCVGWCVAWAALALAGCRGEGALKPTPEPAPVSQPAGQPAGAVVVEASAPIRAAVERAARAYAAAGGAAVSVSGGPGPVGARSGRAAMGLIGRMPTPEEQDLVASRVGLGGIALIVHASSLVRGVGMRQLSGVLGGHVPLWSGLGGGAGRIRLVDGPVGSADRGWFDLLSGGSGRGAGVADPIAAVADDPLALGYADILAAEAAEAAGRPIRRLTVEGREATLAGVGEGYPLARPLFLLTKGAPSGEAAAFLGFLRTEAGQRALIGP